MEKLHFILGVKIIQLDEPLGKGDIIVDDLRITNDKEIRKKFVTSQFMEAVGGLEAQAILTDDALIHGEVESPIPCTPESSHQLLSQLLHSAGLFLNALWLVKDNASTFELGFLEMTLPGLGPVWLSNFLAQTVQTADGTKPKVHFTRAELRRGREIYRNVLLPLSLTGDEEVETNKPQSRMGPINIAHATVPRLKRAFYFLSSARTNRDLGMKIAMYCSLLESLFSTDSNEITHKISHRIAIFLADHPKERCELFKRVKDAYGIRSKVVHGDSLGKSASNDIANISRDADEICRRVLNKIISDANLIIQFNADKKSLDDYFLRSSFGDTTIASPPESKL
jgi:hypothetical protein